MDDLTVEKQLAEIEKKRADRKAGLQKQQDAQLVKDLCALNDLEEQYGDGKVARVDLATYTPGLPTMVIVRAATRLEHKRFQDMCAKSDKKEHVAKADAIKAVNLVADSCIVYPDREIYEQIREVCGGVHGVAGNAALALFSGQVAEEGKG
jgi:hypothetical protein